MPLTPLLLAELVECYGLLVDGRDRLSCSSGTCTDQSVWTTQVGNACRDNYTVSGTWSWPYLPGAAGTVTFSAVSHQNTDALLLVGMVSLE